MGRIPRSFQAWNNILSWLAFLVALTTYTLTLEPTVSFWDTGEYIATSANLEVGHPPGAPVYQMLGALFAAFAEDKSQIALMLNFMSGLCSAFTILFLFRSLSLLLQKISGPGERSSFGGKLAVLGSALVGSLSFGFTDSFWFNAVEAEVYAMSSCLMAMLFYLGLLWVRNIFQPRGNRWLLLISFVVGLSFGVHFLSILAIPALGFLYFFKTCPKVNPRNFLIACISVIAVLLFIFKLLLPYTLAFFATSELFFTNSFGLPFNSGTIAAFLLLLTMFFIGIKYTRRKNYFQLPTLLLCLLFLLIGFSGWIMLPIRANANTVINENRPDDARELLAYYNREQYGETYLFYGPQYTETYAGLDPENPFKDDKPNYEQNEEKGRYVIVNDYENARQNLDDRHKTFLPRMWSSQHAVNYMRYTGYPEFTIKPEYHGEKQLLAAVTDFRRKVASGTVGFEGYHSFLSDFSQYLRVEPPSLLSNLRFMLDYQIVYMYWRYFLWNFVGRQNDIQGKGGDLYGNWLSGINFIDAPRLGSQKVLPTDLESNKARNTYFFLPLLFGLLGLLFHFRRDWKNAWVLLVFFFFTGLALTLYLNQAAFQVRERDYVLVGSFYVFAIWIGFGIYAFFLFIQKFIKTILAAIVAVSLSLVVPTLLVLQNWDDHDRSGRYSALAMAKMYLDSVDPNALLFTVGDNDTFLLWYAQQIEGYRRDVRVVNTTLLSADWHIDQMKRKAWESEPLPSQLEKHQYLAGINDFVIYEPVSQEPMNIDTWMNWIDSDNPGTYGELQSGHQIKTFPSQRIKVPVNKENVLKYRFVTPENAGKIVDTIPLDLGTNILYKNELFMLDILANNDWQRPIYFSGGSFDDKDYLWMKDYLQLEGMVYKLVPIHTPADPENPLDMGRIDTDKMYEIVKQWDWGNMEDPDIYHDSFTRRNGILYRRQLSRLIDALLKERDKARAKDILDLGMEKLPFESYGSYFLLEPFIIGYFEVGKKKKALHLWEKVVTKYQENLRYYSSWESQRQMENMDVIIEEIQKYRSIVDVLMLHEKEELVRKKIMEFNATLGLFPWLE